MQNTHLNSSLSNSSNMTATCDWNPPDKTSSVFPWDFSERTFLAFFLVFLGCVLFSSTANGFLVYLMVRYKQQLWQPQYILINNISACGVGISFVTALVVLSSIVSKKTQIYGYWCIAQFCILRCFFLMSQMTLALMALERYIFICHGIHYLRMINTCNVRVSIGLVWLLSGTVSLHGGFVLSQTQCGFQQQTCGLLCDAFTIKGHITFSWEEGMLVFGAPYFITTFCVLVICYCYGCMYLAALRVCKALKRNNHRANRTVGFYLLMFLLQLALNVSFIILIMMRKSKASFCRTISSIVTPIIIIIPSCLYAVFFLIRNPQIKRLLLSAYPLKCRSTIRSEMEMFELNRGADGLGGRTCSVEHGRQVERENSANTPPLPGNVFSVISED